MANSLDVGIASNLLAISQDQFRCESTLCTTGAGRSEERRVGKEVRRGGIRDTSVTGVQTCALPISPPVANDWKARIFTPRSANARQVSRECLADLASGWRILWMWASRATSLQSAKISFGASQHYAQLERGDRKSVV